MHAAPTPGLRLGVVQLRWAPRSSKPSVAAFQRRQVGSTPIHSRLGRRVWPGGVVPRARGEVSLGLSSDSPILRPFPRQGGERVGVVLGVLAGGEAARQYPHRKGSPPTRAEGAPCVS